MGRPIIPIGLIGSGPIDPFWNLESAPRIYWPYFLDRINYPSIPIHTVHPTQGRRAQTPSLSRSWEEGPRPERNLSRNLREIRSSVREDGWPVGLMAWSATQACSCSHSMPQPRVARDCTLVRSCTQTPSYRTWYNARAVTVPAYSFPTPDLWELSCVLIIIISSRSCVIQTNLLFIYMLTEMYHVWYFGLF